MSNVLNRTTKQYLKSVNTPDYPVSDWIVNPSVAPFLGVPTKYWKISGDAVSEMSALEKLVIDAAEPKPPQETIKLTSPDGASWKVSVSDIGTLTTGKI